MRYISLAAACLALNLLAGAAAAADLVPWAANLDAAKAQASREGKLVLLHFWSTDCEPCLKVEQNVFSDPRVGEALARYFVPVKIDVTQNQALVQQYQVRSRPTDLVITPSGHALTKWTTPQVPESYLTIIQQASSAGGLGTQGMWAAAGKAIGVTPPPAMGSQYQPIAFNAPAEAGAQPPVATVQGISPAAAPAPAGFDTAARFPSGSSPRLSAGQSQGGQPAAGNVALPGGWVLPQFINNPSAAPSASPPPASPPPAAPLAGNNPLPQPAAGGFVIPSAGGNPAAPPSANVASGPFAPPLTGIAGVAPASQAQFVANPAAPPSGAPTGVGQNWAGNGPGPAGAAVQPAAAMTTGGQYPYNIPVQANGPLVMTNPAVAPRPTAPAVQLPPGAPPVGMDGYCPVTLLAAGKWQRGDVRFGAVHRGRTYLFASQREQQEFLANPDKYGPALSGYDPVRFAEQGERVEGKRDSGLCYKGQIFLFSDERSLQRFSASPDRYAQIAEQALKQSASQLRYR